MRFLSLRMVMVMVGSGGVVLARDMGMSVMRRGRGDEMGL
jgi:hypothetical protein